MTLRQLRETSDSDLIALHDKAAKNTFVGVDFYLQEMRHRDMERSSQASTRLARRTFWLAVASTVLAVVATVASVIAIFKK